MKKKNGKKTREKWGKGRRRKKKGRMKEQKKIIRPLRSGSDLEVGEMGIITELNFIFAVLSV